MTHLPGCYDSIGGHQGSCDGNRDLIHRHNFIQTVFLSAAHSSTLMPRIVLPSLIPGTCRHPADVFFPNWMRVPPHPNSIPGGEWWN